MEVWKKFFGSDESKNELSDHQMSYCMFGVH